MKKLFLYLIDDPDCRGTTLAGLAPIEWLVQGAGNTPYRVIESVAEARAIEGYDYVAILYGTTPLVTESFLRELIREMEKRGIEGMEIGDGRLVKAERFLSDIPLKRRTGSPLAQEIKDAAGRHKAEKLLYRKIAEKSVQNGAIIPDVDNVRIDARSRIGRGAVIEPYTVVTGSVVGDGAKIGSFSEIENAEIGEDVIVSRSVVRESRVAAGATIGPFAYIRMGSEIGEHCRIGDFVEVKKSALGAGSKAAHLAYIGDAEVGAATNVGCGTVFANYDGKEKHRTRIGESVFIGANTNLIAPVSVGDGAYIAAATTVTEDVPQGNFVIGRVRAANREKGRK